MAVTVTWAINAMTHMDSDGGVIKASWSCTAKNDSGPESAVEGDKMSFTYDASSPDFTPYADLTEADVIGWVKAALGPDQVSAIEAERTAKVSAQIDRNNSQSEGLPWES